MATVVDVEDDCLALLVVCSNLRVCRGLSNVGEPKFSHGAPHERSPEAYPPFRVSQELSVLGVAVAPSMDLPQSAITMETDDIRQPALQMVEELVPRRSLDQRESHCLYRGKAVAVRAKVAIANSFPNIFCKFIIIN